MYAEKRANELNVENIITKAKSRKDNGSTKFSPVFEYIKINNLRDYILIYFTDGIGEKVLSTKPINDKNLWVLTGNSVLSLEKPYGKVVKLLIQINKPNER